jgi:DNA-binding transcriptional MerR regulator
VERLLSIGRFARLSGLSIDALRHYDELGLLRPESVDSDSGYRRYAHGQLDRARAIVRLRSLDVPLATIAAYLAADPIAARRILDAHLRDIEARTARLQHISHGLRQVINEREDLVTIETLDPAVDRDTRRRLAVDLFNHVWTLLETTGRTTEQDDEMLHAAHASRYHWGEVGDAANRARGEWQCARVYAVLGRPEPSLHHARRCLALCQEHALGDWDLAAAYEAVARASMVAGDREGCLHYLELAREATAAIVDPEDRANIESDLASLVEA